MSLPIETTTIKPRSWFFVLTLMFLIVIYGLASKSAESEEAQFILLIPGIILLVIWFLFSKVNMTIDNAGMNYKTMFSNQSFLWKDVTRTYLKYRHEGKSKQLYWYFEVFDKDYKMAISFYSRKSLQTIADAVVLKCTKAEIDTRIMNMAAGKFPWYIF